MTGNFLIDWLSLAISLLNTLLMVWLGLTVFLNAERRSWGVLLAVGGLIAGALFFISHSIVLSQGASALLRDFNFWWHVGWAPLVAAPFTWYLLMLWYCGFWDDAQSSLHRRQRVWLWFSLAYALLIGGLLLSANPLPSIEHGAAVEVERLPALGGVPLVLLAYPPYILLCIGLALDALLHPVPSGRVMGDLARRRARPWLVSASLVLLLVSLAVGGAILWLLQLSWRYRTIADLLVTFSTTLSIMDLALAGLLFMAVLLMGQAIVSYEIFTGKTLPRRGFERQWQVTVLLSAGLCLISAWGLVGAPSAVIPILAALLLVALSFALFSWQSFRERDRSIRQLRPLVTSPRLLESILTTSSDHHGEADLASPFTALCRDVIGSRRAMLYPLGALAALSGKAMTYPAGTPFKLPALGELLDQISSPQMPGLPLDPGQYDGAIWAAPLWSESGLNGILFLGEKGDGGFYSLEEIEIARASGERLADIQASAEMARRLIALQRQRLAESQVLDGQTRRVLHDEVLPRLHAILLELNRQDIPEKTLTALADAHRQIADLLHNLPKAAPPEIARRGLVAALSQVVEGELNHAFDQVTWNIDPQVEQHAREITPLNAEVIYFAAREVLRNAARHARQPGSDSPLNVSICVAWRDGLQIEILDDGVGLSDAEPDKAGGEGLKLHSTMMAVVGGTLFLESAPGVSTRVLLKMPAR